jgi:DNA-binding MarR family transcriptional regulator
VNDQEAPRWLDDVEREAWLTLIGLIIRLPAALDAQLQHDSAMSHFEYTVLVHLSQVPDRVLRMSRLATLCHSSLSRLSHVVSRLEKRGWLRRETCPDDGRATLAILTDDGFAALAEAAPGHVDAVRAFVIDALDREQLRELTAVGGVILERLEAESRRR